MDYQSPSNFDPTKMTRRQFIWLSAMAAAGVAAGCATNPVTGKQQLMLVSEDTNFRRIMALCRTRP